MADINVTFQMDLKQKEKIDIIAEKNYRSLSAQIRFIIDEYLENK